MAELELRQGAERKLRYANVHLFPIQFNALRKSAIHWFPLSEVTVK